MSNPWDDAKIYKLGNWTIYSIRAGEDKPVRWYLEAHYRDEYRSSHGSQRRTRWGAVLDGYIKALKEAA
jgi:hypothetical protein